MFSERNRFAFGIHSINNSEGENSITSLYIEIAKAKAEAAGDDFDEAELDIPRRFDFRMRVPQRKKA